jgi:pilus assembly protein CpaE
VVAMPEISVVILAADNEQRAVLQVLVDGTSVARTAFAGAHLPVSSTDSALRRVQGLTPDVILVDIASDEPFPALHAIELLHQEIPDTPVFAFGPISQPQLIVNAMRAGAREFIERPTTTTDLLEAFVRLTSAQRKSRGEARRGGKVFSVINAKGGSGATTTAVNVALALQISLGSTALVDLAPLGHAALHLNAKPQFTVADALRNLHRLDSSLLESFMTQQDKGLHLLAGTTNPGTEETSNSELARLFDLLVGHYQYTVVDFSTRFDATARLVCNLSETVLVVAQADVASLWSAARIVQYLSETGGRERIRLVLNRFRKVPGFEDHDTETAVGAKLIWKVPNNYFAISAAIDRGNPPMRHASSEVARAFSGLASALTEYDDVSKRSAKSMFRSI